MIKESDLIGKPLYVKENIVDYVIEQVVYRPKSNEVMGFSLKPYFISTKTIKIIEFKQIMKISTEGIYTSSIKNVILYKELIDFHESVFNCKYIGTEVLSYEGDLIGKVVDTLIDEKKGKVVGILISEGVINDLMDGYCILNFQSIIATNNKFTVLDKATYNIKPYRQGGLKKLLGINSYHQ